MQSSCAVDTRAADNLIDVFSNYFEVIPANTPQLLETVYRLRYQVYCLETGFEDPNLNPYGLEMDSFDKYSVHSLLRYRPTGTYAGTVRLVLPRMDVEKCFPIHGVTHHPFFLDSQKFPQNEVAEISRFAIAKAFRKRLGESLSPSAASSSENFRKYDERRILPHITLGLYLSIVKMSFENGIKHWFCVMEPALYRLLSRSGLHFVPCGSPVNYHGKRQPCYAHADELLGTCREEHPEIWEVITDNGELWS